MYKENLDDIVDKIINLSTNNKEKRLIYLLNNENIIGDFNETLNKCVYKNEFHNIDNLAKELYKYRNSIIHSEDEDRKLPLLLKSSNNGAHINDWNEIVKKLALICINWFSYENKLFIEP